MKRREFVKGVALLGAATMIPGLAMASALDYKPGLVGERLKAGETVFLDFKASWCTTCRAQERVIEKLKSENPAYDQKITFINVDWDEYGQSKLAQSLNIPRRSTLVALRGDQELGRIVADTSTKSIKSLMDVALNAK